METALEIQPFFHTPTGTWSYVASRGSDAVVIDPVLDYDPRRSGRAATTTHGCLLAHLAPAHCACTGSWKPMPMPIT